MQKERSQVQSLLENPEYDFEDLDLKAQVQKDPTKCEMLKHFGRLAGPSVITNVFSYLVMTVNTIFAGQFKEESAAKLAGVGLGSMILGMFCRHVLAGVNCAQETLVSTAFGQGQLKLCGVYLNRGRVIMSVVYLPLALLLSFSYQILIALGQAESVAGYAHEYIIPMIPAMYFLGLFDLKRRFLTCLQYSQAPMVAQIISSMVHIVLCIFCVVKWDMGVAGLGLATMVTYFMMFVITTVYAHCIKDIREAIQWPNRKTFTGWGDYMAIAAPATIMLLAEGWAFNILGVLAGLISVTDQAANTILLMLLSVMFMVPMGIQSAACAIIGEMIGANRVPVAKQYFRVMCATSLVLLLFVQSICYFARDSLVSAFTTDPEVQQLASSCVFIIVLAFTPDMVQGSMQGVIRALDVQKTASYIALASFYLASIPLACILVFKCGMGVEGLWIGMASGILFQAIFYTRLVVQGTDWQQVADEAQKRLAEEQQNNLCDSYNDNSFTSFKSVKSYASSTQANVASINNSFMRARD